MRLAAILLAAACGLAAPTAFAQPFLVPGGQNQGIGGPNGLNIGNQQNGPAGQQGGGNNADFESLMDLIVSTVAPDSWAENGGGEAELRPYVGGVYADASGLLRRIRSQPSRVAADSDSGTVRLASALHLAKRTPKASENADPRAASPLRCVSLARLERELVRRRVAGQPVEQSMLTLAGLRRVQYVILLPPEGESLGGDVVLAGPAGDWRMVGDGRIVATTGEAIVRLDDLLTLLRRGWAGPASPFGCSINPRAESLAAAQQYLSESASKPVPPAERKVWLEGLRAAVGRQDIEVFGVAPTSRAAGVLVEADHHMKLIGMGIADGIPGVESYLDQLAASGKSAPASGGVLRWWFAMNYSAVRASPAGDAFELVGSGAKVMSETELLTARGVRVPAAQADEFAKQFAADFSQHFAELCREYPVYAELRNLFDLALVIEIARAGHEESPALWAPSLFADNDKLPLPTYDPATTVETVVNHRVVNRRRFVAGVSGGVWSDPRSVLRQRTQIIAKDDSSPLGTGALTTPQDLDGDVWWWDAK